MTASIVVDPMTRIEGHLRFVIRLEDQVVTDAHCTADMFRGIEKALIGHDARVAQQVTQRVCGVCPYAHAEAASLALENAMGLKPNANGQRLRNLIVGRCVGCAGERFPRQIMLHAYGDRRSIMNEFEA
ncbi:hypothetical protein G3480_04005 [Thiorhodococcus mannitoliphagus]|uniref:Uptake hydrogenase large subunit n=1 Tax=Thiorhodococcus mannitoliphagus TaxID=329406 RepID=A0A6P1DUW6_9GAMM|nr:nickel-dependent hydrogenase large subunit [Thiorhodococcus mannitoliphagus]NEX19485.1 hypothetical protein [Thiorhodococcus mannitoliphagus]